MREIKFRAWFPGIDVMGNVVTMKGSNRNNYVGDMWDSIVAECTINGRQQFYESIHGKLMQYTGLKDKNGKEIYEGDIITQDRITGVVIYSRNGFYLEWIQNNKARVTLGSPHPNEDNNFSTKCEVIGNIYEHAELLKVPQ